MKLYALILLSLIVVTSCTIERRIHQPGWNVQWKKHYSASQNQNEEDPSMHFEKSQESEDFETPSITAENLIGNETIDHHEPITESASDQVLKSSVSTDELERVNTDQEVVRSTRSNLQEDQVKRSTTKTKFGQGMASPTRLLIKAGIYSILALLLYFSLSVITESIMLIFTVLLLATCAILAIVFLIIGLVLLLIQNRNMGYGLNASHLAKRS